MSIIIGIKINNRLDDAIIVQELLTQYGCYIKTRIGLHEETHNQCSHKGLILLEIINKECCKKIMNDLKKIKTIETQKMAFSN